MTTKKPRNTAAAALPHEARTAASCIKSLVAFQRSLTGLTAPSDRAKASALGYGWWIRVVRSADAVRRLHAAHLSNEASPIVRTVLHHTAALAWLRMDPDEAIAAVVWEHGQRRRRLGQKARERQWDLRGLRLGKPNADARPAGVALLKEAEKLCKRVNAPNLYVAYMIESGYAHPSGVSADAYIEPASGGSIVLRAEPALPGVTLRVTALFAAVATNELGKLIDSEDFQARAEGLGERLGSPVRLGEEAV